MKRILLAGGIAVAFAALALPASALPTVPPPVAGITQSDSGPILVKRGGRGHHYGWTRSRGRHLGFTRGKHRGWYRY
ncbi:MAG: hypothetical protein EPO23_03475 [Xanthobacteraceae bacterium]|nr:MAG: hypothetical protein EPO23_03475 [Xanthobacteraceae bacterium]